MSDGGRLCNAIFQMKLLLLLDTSTIIIIREVLPLLMIRSIIYFNY